MAGVSAVAMFAILVPAAGGSQRGAPDEKRLAFEAATIKLAAPDAVRNRVMSLKVRVENQTANVLTLVVDRPDGKLGPQVEEWDGTCRNGEPSEEDDPAAARCPSGYLAGRLVLDGATMFSVAEALSLPQARQWLGNITVDQTGVKGRYTMALDYQFAPPRPLDPAKPPEFAGPSLFTAVREQWGLRIVPGQGPFKAVVIESAQLPMPN